jgi:hypothetical protein
MPSNHQQAQHAQVQQGQSQKPTYKLVKKPEVNKIKLITPGLKHYATVKHVNRNDYANYFRSRSAHEDQRDASQRLVQSMYRRSARNLVPQYAPSANYGNL